MPPAQENTKKRKKKKEKKKRKGTDELSMCKSTWAFLSIKQLYFLLLVFSPFWGEIFLMDSRRKRLGPTIYFPSSPSNQTHSKKVFLLIFFSKFSINSISPPNKHTLKRINIARNFTNLPISSITILPL